MLTPIFTNRLDKDIKRAKKRGKDMAKFKAIATLIINEEVIPVKYKDHVLVGNYAGRRECHIEPDWLLIYKLDTSTVIFERTGTHADLFLRNAHGIT